MALIYPSLVTDKGIKTNALKEKHSSKKVTILIDINERGIYRTETSLSSSKIEILLVNQLTENDKKKDKQDKEIEICSYSLIAFLHKVQSTKVLSRKGIKDGNMDTIFCNQYAWTDSIWTDSMTKVSNKIIIKDIFTPFIVPLNIHITDILIKESLTDSPLLIIKENINCDNLLNNDRINPLIDCPINEKIGRASCRERV